MSKRVLLTGIAGSIGVHVLGHIMHNTDWEVVGIGSFRHQGLADRLVEVATDHPDWMSRIKMVMHDLSAPISSLTRQRIGHIDYIINLASLSDVEASIQEPASFIQNNVALMVNMLEYAKDIWELRTPGALPPKGSAFIQFSTDEVYGPTTNKDHLYQEWSPHKPSNPYSASKAAQEDICNAYWASYNVPVIITNTMNNFGEMQQPFKFPVIIQKAIAAGEEVTIHGNENGNIGSRSYIHSRNAADALLFILSQGDPCLHQSGKADEPDRYNIAGDRQLDNLELAQLIAELMGKELKYKLINFHKTRPGHDPHYGLDNSKLKDKGWKSPVSFEESLKSTIDWQTEHQDWISKNHL
jgi:dTDP-glucose 4,6-dehydratase